ncbi:MAG: DUF5106 domain-containing protein [Alistipes sp.]|nr:DUF5106 domain-containing protein [Candidatus Minthomonas equi]
MFRNFWFFISLSLTALAWCGCTGRGKSDEIRFPKPFPEVCVPAMVTEGEAYLSITANHFWDSYLDSATVWCEFDDSTRIGGVSREAVMEKYGEYVRFLWNIPVKEALSSQYRLMNRLESAALQDSSVVPLFEYMCSLAEESLYGVNSDFRNEEFYIPVLETMIRTSLESSVTEEVMKEKYRKELECCSKNRIGEKAADFIFCTADGQNSRLYDVESDYILLFFSNPGCTACKEIIESVKSSDKISALIASGSLKVLNIYIDEDLAEWFKYMPVYPKEWINAYQPDLRVRKEEIYDVRAIPSLYILDADKRVVFKDVAPPAAFAFIEHISME